MPVLFRAFVNLVIGRPFTSPVYSPHLMLTYNLLLPSPPQAPGRFHLIVGHLGLSVRHEIPRKAAREMGRLRRKRMHKNDKHLKKKYRTKRRTKDLDQIHEDMQPKNAAKLKSQACDMDLPGSGQYYCIQCA